ncbi:F-box/FBD/LRR-repeat protein At1g13570 isoform X2 [Helianthus annuus]|uniref:F-box/FBD/LRR-repeat protein At1g13570 isoform X2 n=1 Tax=Helianthus annuus TaxID=4232 RepID=UPI001652D13E|nr:F-box/FBD/LRR-repeat protein At1g13570 isoform X2 [Helianthus annuus]
MHKAERMSLDRISTLPQPILEAILCHLSTKEAARTSILSREWRYKWTTIPKLELSHSVWCESASNQTSGIASSRRNRNMRCKSCYDMQHILLLRQGPIHELSFYIPEDDCLGLDPIMLHLSRNHPVKKLTLSNWDCYSSYKLPTSLFSFHHLTDLDINCLDINCLDLDHPQIFNGFGSLKTLCLRFVGISSKTLLCLLSNCPSLKTLTLLVGYADDKCTVNELFECLPMIEHLTTWPRVSRWLVLDLVLQVLPTSLIHLKDICFEQIFRVHGYGLAFLLVLIKCSPNLETIKLEMMIVRNTSLYGKNIQMFGWSI